MQSNDTKKSKSIVGLYLVNMLVVVVLLFVGLFVLGKEAMVYFDCFFSSFLFFSFPYLVSMTMKISSILFLDSLMNCQFCWYHCKRSSIGVIINVIVRVEINKPVVLAVINTFLLTTTAKSADLFTTKIKNAISNCKANRVGQHCYNKLCKQYDC